MNKAMEIAEKIDKNMQSAGKSKFQDLLEAPLHLPKLRIPEEK